MNEKSSRVPEPVERLYKACEYPERPARDVKSLGNASLSRLATREDFYPPRSKPEPGTIVLPATLLVEDAPDGSRLTSMEYAGLPLTPEQTARGCLIVGATGSGKTYHTYYPAIAAYAEQTEHNLLMLNTKGPVATAEMAAMVRQFRPECRVIVLAPGDASRSLRFNPLDYARRRGMLDVLVRSMENCTQEGANDSGYWRATAKRILGALFKHPEVESIHDARELLEDTHALRSFLEASPDTGVASFLDFYESGSHNAMTNLADMANRVAAFAGSDDAVAVTSSDCEIDLHERLAGDEPFALIIEANESTFESEAPLLNLFLALVFRTVTAIAESRPDMRLPRRLAVLLDEFGTIGRVDGFERVINTGRSRGLILMCLVQTLAQLRVYGDAAESVLAGFGSKVFLLSGLSEFDKQHASACSGMTITGCWRETQSYDTLTGGWGTQTRTWSQERRPLLTPEDLSLRKHGVFGGYAVGFLLDRPPVMMHFTPAYELPHLSGPLEKAREAGLDWFKRPEEPEDEDLPELAQRAQGQWVFSDMRGWSLKRLHRQIYRVLQDVGLPVSGTRANDWWAGYFDWAMNGGRPKGRPLLRLLEELRHRDISIPRYFEALNRTGTDNMAANLFFAQYLREAERPGSRSQSSGVSGHRLKIRELEERGRELLRDEEAYADELSLDADEESVPF